MNTWDPATESVRSDAPELRAFGREVESRGLYLSPTLQQRLDLIEHLIEFGRQIILLSGSVDSGKSTLLNYFTVAQRASWCPIPIHAGPGLTAEGLLGILAQKLEIAPETAGPVSSDQVRQRIAALERTGKVVVLLVDDAEQLLPETSTMVVKLAHADDQFAELRVLLAADLDQSALLETLQRAHPQHGLVHVVEIPRLIDTQVQSLIEQRMRAAELDAASYFSAQDYARIAAAGGGMVGMVVTLARQHMAGIAVPVTPVSPPRGIGGLTRLHVNVVFGILAAAAVAVGAWWATRNPLEPASQTESVALTPPPEQSSPMETASVSPPSAPLTLEGELEVPASASTTAVDSGADDVPLRVPVEPDLPTADPIPAPVATAPPAATATVEAPVETAPPENPLQAAIETPPSASSTGPSISNFSAEWLRKQPDSAHILQLFGVRERAAAERYRVQRGIINESAIVTGTLDGKPWYVVVYGYYPNRTAAVAAMRHLPSSLRDIQPWARSIGSLRGSPGN